MSDPAERPPASRPSVPRWVDVADLLTLVLFALAFVALFFGGLTIPLGPFTFRARSQNRLVFEALLVLVGRHYFVPAPSLRARLIAVRDDLTLCYPHLMAVLPVWFFTRGMVLLAGYLAVRTFGFHPADSPPRISPNELLNLPVRWDSSWYVEIAASGYAWDPTRQGQQSLAFFPANPMIMRVAWWLTHDRVPVAWTGAAVAAGAFLAALVLLHRMTRERFGDDTARWTVLLMAAYPFAVFYSVPYTEGLFVFAAVGAFYFFERARYLAAAALGLLAGLVRPNGWWLTGALALLIWTEIRKPEGRLRLSAPVLIALLAPVAGVAIYSAAVFVMTGDPFTWMKLHAAWGRRFVWIDRTALLELDALRQIGTFDWLARRPSESLNLLGTCLALASIWPVTRRFGVAYGGFVAANTIGPLLFGGLLSMGRLTSVLFPMFIWLASTSPAVRPLLLVIFAFVQAIVAALFFTWRPLF